MEPPSARRGIDIFSPLDLPRAIAERQHKADVAFNHAQLTGAADDHQILGPIACMSDMTMGLSQKLEQKLQLKISFRSIYDEFGEIYDKARKRDYSKHGLEFTYAVVSRKEFPYLVRIQSAGICYQGMIFVMEDFLLDLSPKERDLFEDIVAVHEYGESVFGNHHQASMLEFRVAQLEGFLERYLEIMEQKYSLKFRDVALHRMLPGLRESLREKEIEIDLPDETEVSQYQEFSESSVRRAEALRDEFTWPDHLVDRYAAALDEDEGEAREALEKWAESIAVSQHVHGYLNRATETVQKLVRKDLTSGEDQSFQQILMRAVFAFYSVLRPMAAEFDEDALTREDVVDDVVSQYTRDAREALKAALVDGARGTMLAAEIDPIISLIDRMTLPIENFDGLLQTFAQEDEWLEAFYGEDELSGILSEDPDDERITSVRVQLWDHAWTLVEGGSFPSVSEAIAHLVKQTATLKRIGERLKTTVTLNGEVVHGEVEAPSPEIYLATLQDQVLWHLAECSQTEEGLEQLDDVTVRDLIDREIDRRLEFAPPHFDQALEPGTRDRVPKIDITALRRDYGPKLERYREPKNHPRRLYADRLIQLYQEYSDTEVLSQIIDQLRALEVSRKDELGDPLGFKGIILRQVKDQSIPEEVAVRILVDYWQRYRPFGIDVALIPYFQDQWGLTQNDVRRLIAYQILQNSFFKQCSEEPFLLRAAGHVPASVLISMPSDNERLLKEGMGLETGAILPLVDLPKLAEEVVQKGRAPVLDDLEAYFAERKMPLKRIQRDDELLRTTFNLQLYRAVYFQNGLKTDDEVKDLLRRLSAGDWFELESDPRMRGLPPDERPNLEPLLSALDRIRRLRQASLLSQDGETQRALAVSRWDDTSVDRPFLLGLAEKAGTSWLEVAKIYKLLLDFPADKRIEALGPALDLFLDCGVPRLEETARLIRRDQKRGSDRHGSLGTGVKQEYLAEAERGNDTHADRLWEHFKSVTQYASELTKKGQSRERCRITMDVEADLVPIILKRGAHGPKELFGLWTWASMSINSELVGWVQEATSKKALAEAFDAIVQWGRKLQDYSERKIEGRFRTLLNEAALTILKCSIAQGKEFGNWEEAEAYVAEQMPGYDLKPAEFIALRWPFSRILGDVEKHLRAHKKSPTVSSQGSAREMAIAAEIEKFLTATQGTEEVKIQVPVEELKPPFKYNEIGQWVNSYGTLSPDAVRQFLGFCDSEKAVTAYIRRRQLGDTLLERLIPHWTRILQTLPIPENDATVVGLRRVINDVAVFFRRLEIPIAYESYDFFKAAYPELSWRHIVRTSRTRNWNEALEEARINIKWGSGFSAGRTFEYFIEQKRDVAAVEAGFVTCRERIWTGTNPPAPKPSPEELNPVLEVAGVSSSQLDEALHAFLNKPPLYSMTAEEGRKALIGYVERMELARQQKGQGELKGRFRSTLVQLICYCHAQAYTSGYRGRTGLGLGSMNRILPRLLLEELVEAIQAGKIFRDWGDVKTFVVKIYPPLGRYTNVKSFKNGLFHSAVWQDPNWVILTRHLEED